MSVAEKKWFALSIAGMVVADGRTDQSEMSFLREAINFLPEKEEINNTMAVIKECKTPELGPLNIDPKQAFLMLKYLAQLMVVDADLSTKGINQSKGLMVNYLYNLDTLEENHELFFKTKEVQQSDAIKSLRKKLQIQ